MSLISNQLAAALNAACTSAGITNLTADPAPISDEHGQRVHGALLGPNVILRLTSEGRFRVYCAEDLLGFVVYRPVAEMDCFGCAIRETVAYALTYLMDPAEINAAVAVQAAEDEAPTGGFLPPQAEA